MAKTIKPLIEDFHQGRRVSISPDSLATLIDHVASGDESARPLLVEVLLSVPLEYGYWTHIKSLYKALEQASDTSRLVAALIARFETSERKRPNERIQFADPSAWTNSLPEHGQRAPTLETLNYLRRRARRYIRALSTRSGSDYVSLAILILDLEVDAGSIRDSWLHCELTMGAATEMVHASHSRGRILFPQAWAADCTRRERFQNIWNQRIDDVAEWMERGSLMRAEFAARILIHRENFSVGLSQSRILAFLKSANVPLVTYASNVLEREPERLTEIDAESLAKGMLTLGPWARLRLWEVCKQKGGTCLDTDDFARHFDCALFYLTLPTSYGGSSKGRKLLALSQADLVERALWALRLRPVRYRQLRLWRHDHPVKYVYFTGRSAVTAWNDPAWGIVLAGWWMKYEVMQCTTALSDHRLYVWLLSYDVAADYVAAAEIDRLVKVLRGEFGRYSLWEYSTPSSAPIWFMRLIAHELLVRMSGDNLSAETRNSCALAIVDMALEDDELCAEEDLNRLIVDLPTSSVISMDRYRRALDTKSKVAAALTNVLISRLEAGEIIEPDRHYFVRAALIRMTAAGHSIRTKEYVDSQISKVEPEGLALLFADIRLGWISKAIAKAIWRCLQSNDLSEGTRRTLFRAILGALADGRHVIRRQDAWGLIANADIQDVIWLAYSTGLPEWLAKQILRYLSERVSAVGITDEARSEIVRSSLLLVQNKPLLVNSKEMRSFLFALDAKRRLNVLLGLNDDQWHQLCSSDSGFFSRAENVSDLMDEAWATLSDENESTTFRGRLKERILNSSRLQSRHLVGVDFARSVPFGQDQANTLERWIRHHLLRPALNSSLLFACCTDLNDNLRDAALDYAENVGFTPQFGLRLLESKFPPAVERAESFFRSLGDLDCDPLYVGLMLCDSPEPTVQAFGIGFLECHRESIPKVATIRALAESTGAVPRFYVAQQTQQAHGFKRILETYDVEILSERNRHRKAREIVKGRRSKDQSLANLGAGTSQAYLRTLIDLAHGDVIPDAEWALTELVQLERLGVTVPGFQLVGPTEES